MVQRINTAKIIGGLVIINFTAIMVIYCGNSSKVKKNKIVQESSSVQAISSAMVVPSPDPIGTVKSLYSDSIFFNLRNKIPATEIRRLGKCMTADLRDYLEKHNNDVEVWLSNEDNKGLKIPVPEGPVFLSNFEGGSSWKAKEARVDETVAEVSVALSFSSFMGEVFWEDVVVLLKVGNIWLLDNINFQSESDIEYTLRDRMTLEE